MRATPPFAQYVTEGLLFDVLAGEMEVEEPDAAEIISAAANIKNANTRY